ncbi:alpha-amylase family protein [Vallitalea okinawensis]|uniref:alpha-amylase family protein n=1 Tax=Vallitalea okinawensis TaxID=2078660 RepID=UPI001A9A68AB|nr:alpha-amylase family protein [Vallitalea okinawensis]
MGNMPFRQIHLDFHTGDKIPGVGSEFSKEQFQNALQVGHVNSINIFAKCHHGWLYYKNGVTPSHPSLEFDLVEEMLSACEEIGVETQLYISAGLDEITARKHPEWLFRRQDQKTTWATDFMQAGYHELCMNTPYLGHLLSQIEEVTRRFDTTGIWLDIVGIRPCYCQTCVNQIIEEGNDPRDEKAIIELAERVYKNYLKQVQELIHSIKPEMKIFQNSGHVTRGRRDILEYYTHLELESLPTGGWGYDHFPLSARYVQGLRKEFLGMTGKFHTTWGEFGGFKHPNALRYEAALNLANGAKMCIGDQLHPVGKMDEVTYKLVGEAYKEVEKKEAWCDDVVNVADIGLLSQECLKDFVATANQHGASTKGDTGAVRMLLEGNYLFDVMDYESNFNQYKVIILPDSIKLDKNLEKKVIDYITNGGKILATGKSGLNQAEDQFLIELGVKFKGESSYHPDYFIPSFDYHGLGSSAFVMFGEGINIAVDGGKVLGEREEPYFNRDMLHFSSHFHTPNQPGKRSAGMVEGDAGIYIAWKVFEDYATKGSLILKDMVKFALDRLLGVEKTVETTLGAQGVTTLQHQYNNKRYVNHLLYATPVKRGNGVEVIEDLVPVMNIKATIKLDQKIKKVYLAPQLIDLPFAQDEDKITYTVGEVNCHQMVVLEY